MEKKTFILTSLSVFTGLVLAGLVLFGLYTLRQDHKNLQEVISFLNSQIAMSKQTGPVQK